MLEVNVYFATDYQSFLERIARARVFEMTEERSKALSEIKEALSLVRGKPFEKMYDNFAEDTRTRILLEIDSASNKLKELQAGVRS